MEIEKSASAPSHLTSVQELRYDVDDQEEEGYDEEDGEEGDKYALMTAHLYQEAQSLGWFKSKKVLGMGAVSIRMGKRQYK